MEPECNKAELREANDNEYEKMVENELAE